MEFDPKRYVSEARELCDGVFNMERIIIGSRVSLLDRGIKIPKDARPGDILIVDGVTIKIADT